METTLLFFKAGVIQPAPLPFLLSYCNGIKTNSTSNTYRIPTLQTLNETYRFASYTESTAQVDKCTSSHDSSYVLAAFI